MDAGHSTPADGAPRGAIRDDADDLIGLFILLPRRLRAEFGHALGVAPSPDALAAAVRAKVGDAGGAAAALAEWALASNGAQPAAMTLAERDATLLQSRPPRGADVLLRTAYAVARLRRTGRRIVPALFGVAGRPAAPVAPGFELWETALREARGEIGRFNIIVAGRTGVGKTTLIGAVFGAEIGDTLAGRPRTRGRVWYPETPVEADMLRLCDTEGLETARYHDTVSGLAEEVAAANASGNPFDHIHVAWLCIDEPSQTIEPAEEALATLFAQHGVPVLVVLTKAGMAPDFVRVARDILPGAQGFVRVRAKALEIEGQSFAPFGLEALRDATAAVIPAGVGGAFAVAARNLAEMVQRAQATVGSAAAAASAAGAAPVPLADAAALFAIQTGMLVRISLQMGVRLERRDLRLLAVTLAGATGATFGGRLLAAQAAKLIPGLGSIAGGAIAASTAGAATYALGRAYVAYLRGYIERAGHSPTSDEIASGFKQYWRRLRSAPPD